MAEWISDGFDKYTAVADAGLGNWDTVNAISLSSTTRFNIGQSFSCASSLGGSIGLKKAVALNDSTVFITLAHRWSGSAQCVPGFVLSDGSTAQCGVWFENDNSINLRAGISHSGTILATFQSAFITAVWDHFQIAITIDGTNGEIHIRKNGNSVDDFSATGLDTQASANAYANTITIIAQGGAGTAGAVHMIDDLLIFGSSGDAPNTWVGDIRCSTHYPCLDVTKVFTPSPTEPFKAGTTTQTGTSTVSLAAGTTMTGRASTPSEAINVGNAENLAGIKCGEISQITVNFNAGFTGNAVCGIWDDTGAGGSPGALLGTTNTVANPVAGENIFTFPTNIDITYMGVYYYGILTNTSCVLKAGGSVTHYLRTGQTYPTLPDPFSASSSPSTVIPVIYATVVNVPNAAFVAEEHQDGDTSFVSSPNVGDIDMYSISPFTTTPAFIIGVKGYLLGKKTDTSAKTGRLRLLSGTALTTSDVLEATSYTWHMTSFLPTDPNTSAAWTAAAAVDIQVGPEVVA